MRTIIQVAAIALVSWVISIPQLLFAQSPQLTVRILAIVDYPGSGNSTTVQGINDFGDVVGYFEDSSGGIRSFIRYTDGTFSEPIVEPKDVGKITIARDIDNIGRICGYYFDALDVYGGFFLSGTTFTEYTFPTANKYLTGINDVGDFCGTSDLLDNWSGFLVLGDGSGASNWYIGSITEANAVNIHKGIVGDYTDEFDFRVHGYLKDTHIPFGRFMQPVDYPGSSDTYLLGLNGGGRVIVGKYVDNAGATHGLILQRPDAWTTYDYPGAIETSLNGINNNKVISGYYADSSGVRHGFIGKVHE